MVTMSKNKKVTVESLFDSFPSWAHPDVQYYKDEWQKLRDAAEGERAVKSRGSYYLKQRDGMDDDVYELFIENATYYNMTGRTIGALVGTIFRRNPIIVNLPTKFNKSLSSISKRGQTFRTFARVAARELIHMGRYGVLVDRDKDGAPYLTGYVTEAILDWDTEVFEGRERLSRVVLMEVQKIDVPTIPNANALDTSMKRYAPQYRELVIEDGIYKQKIYRTMKGDGVPAPGTVEPDETIIPTNRGTAFNFIPFKIIGPEADSFEISRSPMQDIADMNISHYKSYAELEHGRFYTASPVWYVSKGDNDGEGEYTLGSSGVWEIGNGQKAGLLEFNGHGLNSLEKALTYKESHIATLGGRLIGVDSQSVSESDNQLAMKDRNEQALLLNVALSMDECFSKIMSWWAWWQDTSKEVADSIEVEFNKEFLLKDSGAREFRAVHQMYTDGIIPIEVVYDYLHRAEVIPDWMSFEEFAKLLEKKNSFPNNPDIEAQHEGYPDAKTKIEVEESAKDREQQAKSDASALAQARQTQQQAQQNRQTQTPSAS